MAAAKPEVLISQFLGKVETKFQLLHPPLSGSSFSVELLSILWDETGSQKSKMAAVKPEVLLSRLIGEVETKFEMLYPHF